MIEGEREIDEAVAATAPAEQEGESSAGAGTATASPSELPGDGPAAEEEGDAQAVADDLDALAAKAAERDEYLKLAQRTQADFENYRKRVARDSAVAELRGIAKLAKELLPGLDSLERALEAAEATGADSGAKLAEGVRLVQAELNAALARVGLEQYSPRGERFDPELHEAMAQQPGGDDAESGTILEVYQPGYRLDGNVIRPARVVVAA